MLHVLCFVSRIFSLIFFSDCCFSGKSIKTRVDWQDGTNVLRKLAALIVFVPWKWDQGIPFKGAYNSTKLHIIIPEENNLEEICISEVNLAYVFLLIYLMITLHRV
jgi:hypothetical protein